MRNKTAPANKRAAGIILPDRLPYSPERSILAPDLSENDYHQKVGWRVERVPCTYMLTDIRYEETGFENSEFEHAADGSKQAEGMRSQYGVGERDRAIDKDRRRDPGVDSRTDRDRDNTDPQAELWVVIQGSGTVELANQSWPLQPGRMLLGLLGGKYPQRSSISRQGHGFDAGIVFPEKSVRLSFYRLRFCMLGADGVPMPPDTELPFVGAADVAPFSFCAERARRLYDIREHQEAAAALERQIAFQELLLAAVRGRAEHSLIGTGKENADVTSIDHAADGAAIRSDSREAVKRSVARIVHEYRESLTVESLAASAGIGRWTYTQLFKDLTGKLPLDYLNEIRIAQAKHLLISTEDRLGEIAQRIGFNSEYYFSRRFKQAEGLSPGRYRRIRRQEVRVFAPYLEDALLALGIVPVAQYSHRAWGVQEYLSLGGVPPFDIANGTREDLSLLKPELLLFDDGFERWSLDRLSGVAPSLLLEQPGEAWSDKLRGTAALFGREAAAEEAVRRYEEEKEEAGTRLAAVPGGAASIGTVACLRITARSILVYAERAGYTGPLLYGALGLRPPELLRRLPDGQRSRFLHPEELALLGADHLFIVFDKSENRQDGEERRLLNDPCWRRLPAVQAGRVYEMDFFAWMNYGVLAHGRKIRDVMNVLR